eukprot:scaffold3282_cov101-Isochrysis_galbana.AAC.10
MRASPYHLYPPQLPPPLLPRLPVPSPSGSRLLPPAPRRALDGRSPCPPTPRWAQLRSRNASATVAGANRGSAAASRAAHTSASLIRRNRSAAARASNSIFATHRPRSLQAELDSGEGGDPPALTRCGRKVQSASSCARLAKAAAARAASRRTWRSEAWACKRHAEAQGDARASPPEPVGPPTPPANPPALTSASPPADSPAPVNGPWQAKPHATADPPLPTSTPPPPLRVPSRPPMLRPPPPPPPSPPPPPPSPPPPPPPPPPHPPPPHPHSRNGRGVQKGVGEAATGGVPAAGSAAVSGV